MSLQGSVHHICSGQKLEWILQKLGLCFNTLWSHPHPDIRPEMDSHTHSLKWVPALTLFHWDGVRGCRSSKSEPIIKADHWLSPLFVNQDFFQEQVVILNTLQCWFCSLCKCLGYYVSFCLSMLPLCLLSISNMTLWNLKLHAESTNFPVKVKQHGTWNKHSSNMW